MHCVTSGDAAGGRRRELRSWCLLSSAGWGAWRIADGSLTREGTPIRVGLIQGNIAQEDKWNPRQARRIFTTYIAMTRDAVRRGARVRHLAGVVHAVHVRGSDRRSAGEAMLRELAREVRVPILFGSDQVIRRQPVESSELYNAAFQLDPDGKTIGGVPQDSPGPVRRVLPVPAVDRLSPLPLVQRFAPFAAGTDPVMLPVGSHRASTAICYEVVFPSLVRDAVPAAASC